MSVSIRTVFSALLAWLVLAVVVYVLVALLTGGTAESSETVPVSARQAVPASVPDCSVPDCSVPECSVPECSVPECSVPD